MRFSTVITNYKYDEYLDEAISSVLNQYVLPESIIVVNDNSCFRSTRCQSALIKYVDVYTGKGQANALNAGISLVEGDVVTFLDADDLYPQSYYEVLLNIYQDFKADAIYTRPVAFKNNDELWRLQKSCKVNPLVKLEADLCFLQASPTYWWLGVPTSGISIRAAHIKSIFPIPYPSDWIIAADQPICQRINYIGKKIYFVDEPRILYRLHDRNSFTRRKDNRVINDRDFKYTKSLIDFLGKNPHAFTTISFVKSAFRTLGNIRRLLKIMRGYIYITKLRAILTRSRALRT